MIYLVTVWGGCISRAGDSAEKRKNFRILPTVRGMAADGYPYHGVLYAGLMLDGGRPKLLEYNVRFGDPECQCLMVRLGAQALHVLAGKYANTVNR